jgi:hypothetical protein
MSYLKQEKQTKNMTLDDVVNTLIYVESWSRFQIQTVIDKSGFCNLINVNLV